jgi:hypothetical protein
MQLVTFLKTFLAGIILLGFSCPVVCANTFTDSAPDHLWNAPENWSAGVPVRGAANQWGDMTVDGTTCIIDSSHVGANAAEAGGCYPGAYGGDNEMYMTGGELTVNFFNIGRGDSEAGSNAYFQMTGGTITAEGEFKIPQQFDEGSPGGAGNIVGHADLHGGTINCLGQFHMGNRLAGTWEGGIGTMDVGGGTLIVDGDSTSQIQDYFNNGWITAYGGSGQLELDYNVRNAGKTTLTAMIVEKAHTPDPAADNATAVSPDVVVSWIAGASATSHDVYFGTTNPPPFIRNQPLAQLSYDPNGLAFYTTYYWRIDEVNGPTVWQGDLWQFTTGGPPSQAQLITPADGATSVIPSMGLNWLAGQNADSHDVFWGTNPAPGAAEFQGNQTLARFTPASQDPDTTFYWRIDEKNVFGATTGPVWSYQTGPPLLGDINGDWKVDILDLQEFVIRWLDNNCDDPGWCSRADLSQDTRVDYTDFSLLASEINLSPKLQPPYTDYNAMLSQEIQGKKHGFMAGNLTYYIGGHHAVWNKTEDETIGLTHPFYHDLRSRGTGMVQEASTGYGHDLASGSWDFYQFSKVAYGTVIIGQTEYPNPVPTAMYWQPDKMICEYQVGGVNIHEEKFIADNDAACTVITSDAPVTLKFKGQSFWSNSNSLISTATCTFDAVENLIRIAEGGTINVVPCNGCSGQSGVSVYDGMTTVLTSDRPMTDYSATANGNNQWFYEFKVSCDSNGVAIVWAMDDFQNNAIAEAQEVASDPAGKMQAKSDHMNDILNYQIPYFRCSDQDIVDIYYYLWAINLMYYIDVGIGWEQYPHTQTAVNNFLGMHRYDAVFQIQVGSWAVDKEFYANGNALIWTALEPFAQGCGMISDNMGIGWHSGFYGPEVIAHVPGAWQIYEHSGDLAFLSEIYDFYKALFWNGVCEHWGYMFNGAESLAKMAIELGHPADADHWNNLVNMDNIDNWLNNRWDPAQHIFNPASPQGWTSMAYMGMNQFPDDWAAEMTEHWAMDNVDGFFAQVPLSVRALKDWGTFQSGDHPFVVTPDTNWYALRGMYMHHVGNNANVCTLGHLKNYNMYWNIPIAPESFDINFEPWGDQYSNFNAGKILLILEGILGLSYSVIDDSFTISDHLPMEWDYMETYVPIHENGETQWTRVRVSRNENGPNVEKTVTVEGNSRATLNIQPWLEEKNLLTAPGGYVNQQPVGHIDYQFGNVTDQTIQIILEN